jgi:RNA polymerase-binding transcription factor DksA
MFASRAAGSRRAGIRFAGGLGGAQSGTNTAIVSDRPEGTMTKTEIPSYRQRLLALKKRLGGDLKELEEEALRPAGGEAAGGLSDVPIHPADVSAENYEEEVTVGLLENEDLLLTEVNDALNRIDRGTYGRCENCGQPIAKERLDALPYARYCLRCARLLQGGVGA